MTNAEYARPLHFDRADERPDSALTASWLSLFLFGGGVAGTVLIPLAFVLLVAFAALFSWLFSAVVDVLTDEEVASERLLEEDVIEARFVRLGRDFEDELPNRVVPIQASAPPPPSEVPSEAPPPEVAPSDEPPPPNAVQDLLTRLNDRSQAFAELAEARELEGRADGVEEGTETEASEGDAYAGRVKSFFQRGWSIPTTMSREDARSLVATISVSIGPELQILSFEIRSSSGNPLFDESILQQVTRLQAADGRIPPPPEEVADRYIGQTIAVRFSGRQAG